jgi:hypothetical protein
MKTSFKLSALLLVFAATFGSCNSKEEEPECPLPPETQVGANTFGAFVDGKPFVQSDNDLSGYTTLWAMYSKETKQLGVFCVNNGDMILVIDNPQEGVFSSLTLATYYYSTLSQDSCLMYACEDCGEAFITRFDTVNHVVSGRFEFSGRCAVYLGTPTEPELEYTGYATAQITKGRFDISIFWVVENNQKIKNHEKTFVIPATFADAFIFLVTQTIKGSNIQRHIVPEITSVHYGGTIEIRLSPHNASGKIKKPLIVAEGFDPSPQTSPQRQRQFCKI